MSLGLFLTKRSIAVQPIKTPESIISGHTSSLVANCKQSTFFPNFALDLSIILINRSHPSKLVMDTNDDSLEDVNLAIGGRRKRKDKATHKREIAKRARYSSGGKVCVCVCSVLHY